MEEVDNILLHSLRQLHCPLEDEVQSVTEFTPDQLVTAAVSCLQAIDGEKYSSVPMKLPSMMSAKYRVCTQLATALEEMGYQGSIGYERFLYPSEKDTRKMLSFLLERVPKPEEQSNEQVVHGEGTIPLSTRVKQACSDRRYRVHIPWAVRKSLGGSDVNARGGNLFCSCRLDSPKSVSKGVPKSQRQDVVEYASSGALKYVSSQVRPKSTFIASLIDRESEQLSAEKRAVRLQKLAEAREMTPKELQQETVRRREQIVSNALRVAVAAAKQQRDARNLNEKLRKMMAGEDGNGGKLSSRFRHEAQFGRNDDTQQQQILLEKQRKSEEEKMEEEQRRREEELQDLQKQVEDAESRERHMKLEIREATTLADKLISEIEQVVADGKKLEEMYLMKKKILDLLADKDENIRQLREMTNESAGRILDLAGQWEGVREVFVRRHRELRRDFSERRTALSGELDAIKNLRDEMRLRIADVRDRDEQLKALRERYEQMPKNIDRHSYVSRIMDIIKNVRKQQREIVKILLDNRQLMKEINKVTEAIQRSFTLTEELVYEKAQVDDTRAEAYRRLIQLRDGFDALISHVEETGAVQNETRDIENRVRAMQLLQKDRNVERINADLEEVKKENQELSAQLK